MAAVFGLISGTATGVIINEISKKTSVEIAEARDEDGKVTDRKAYSKRTEYSVSGLIDTSTTLEAGQAIASIEGTLLIESVDIGSSNTGYQTFSATCSRVDSETAVAYA